MPSQSDLLAGLRGSLLAHTRYMHQKTTGKEWYNAPHQVTITDALERCVLGKTTRLIINIAPRSGKTDLAVKHFIAWALGLFPSSHFIHSSYSARLASANTYSTRAIMQHEAYKQLWPDVELMQDSKAKDEFRTTAGGVVYAAGAAGSITGYGAGGMEDGKFAGAIILDDPHKAGEALSDTMREGVIDWFQTTIENRKNSPGTPIILIMQRLHEADLAGWLLDGGNGEKWEHINIPAVNNDGESFWPRQFPLEMLNRLEAANPYIFSGQYMQQPTPSGGGDFKPANIQLVDALPTGLKFTRGWDLAATTNKMSDYTASAKMAIDGSGIVWIADVHRLRAGPEDVESLIVQSARLDGKDTRQSLPKDPGQAGVAQAANLSKKLQGVRFEFTPESGDKRSRAMPFAAQVNAGNVRLLNNPQAKEFLHELEAFPNGANDDYVDSCSRAYNDLITQKQSTLTTRRLF